MLSKKNLSFFFLLFTALLLSTWSAFIIYQKKAAAAKDDPGRPDAFMEEVIATIIDKQGKLSIRIVSPKMTHYPKGDTTEITKPYLTLFRHQTQAKPWHLSAEHARALQGTDQILLWENVTIQHPGDLQNEQTTLLTPTLTVFPSKQLAETLDPITILQPDTKISAIGMNADLASGAVTLLSQTKGEYRVEDL